MIRIRYFALALITALPAWSSNPALAQTVVVASCPSAGFNYPLGSRGQPYAIDIHGTICTTGGGGDATAANQVTGNTSLATIATNTGAAIPAGTALIGGASTYANVAGTQTALRSCQSSVIYDASTNGSTELVALTGGQTIRVCGYEIFAGGTANVKLTYGTGTACATGLTSITPAFQLTAQTGIVSKSVYWQGLAGAVSNALCINASAGVAVQAIVYYSKD